ncbi:MAG: hypothetical protein IJ356_02925 [Erysipelotrichaceae bacterium]|nr:hypothetical protein [Erysipelotrichaceae bacterium]
MIKRLFLTVLAGVFIGAGVGMILYANIGGDTVTVFQDGLHLVLGISYGQASRLYNMALILSALFLARNYFGVGTLISALITGYFIDIVFEGLTLLHINTNIVGAFVIFMLGQTIYTMGLSILIRCQFGMNALDSLLYKVNELTKISYRKLRLIVDLLLTLFGYLLGGVVGLGTLISMVFTGVMIDWFSKIKFIKKII